MGSPDTRARAIKIGESYFPEAAFLSAMNEAALDRIFLGCPEGQTTMREAMRSVRDAKTPETYRAVRDEALRRVMENVQPLAASDVLVIARFSAPPSLLA